MHTKEQAILLSEKKKSKAAKPKQNKHTQDLNSVHACHMLMYLTECMAERILSRTEDGGLSFQEGEGGYVGVFTEKVLSWSLLYSCEEATYKRKRLTGACLQLQRLSPLPEDREATRACMVQEDQQHPHPQAKREPLGLA